MPAFTACQSYGKRGSLLAQSSPCWQGPWSVCGIEGAAVGATGQALAGTGQIEVPSMEACSTAEPGRGWHPCMLYDVQMQSRGSEAQIFRVLIMISREGNGGEDQRKHDQRCLQAGAEALS